ncbi:MAG TPA: Holliday junction branch migration protein RuvA [Acidimicrobiia bacterium]|nr:Holliday junction branch migration protein RuvA [Acidimicrobiia bacterium]
MIGMLRGVVVDRGADEVVLDVAGVGYRTRVTPRTLVALDPGNEVTIHTHLHVREDAMVLYGFETKAERATFELLCAAPGVGPKLALSILAVHEPLALRRALIEDDIEALTLVPGVGKRTAQKLLVELKSRFELPDLEVVPDGARSPRAEVRAALAGLGYDAEEVRGVLSSLPDDEPVEDMLRRALRQLAAERVS